MKPRWRTDILSHWSRRCLTGPQEFLSPHPDQGRRRVQKRGSHPVQAVRVPSHAVWVDEYTNYQATIPIRDKSSAEQRRVKRGLTLPEMPEWRTRVHLTTEKSSGTQRAGICIPREESIYAPRIRKMTSPPRGFTAIARRDVERSRRSKSQHEASRNTKQVETRSKSKHEASRNMKQVETRSRSTRKAKASGKTRRKQV